MGGSRYRIVEATLSAGGALRTLISGRATDGCCDPVLTTATGQILFVSNFTLTSATGGTARKLFSSTPWYILSPNRQTAAFTDGCGCGHAPDAVGLIDVRGGKPLVVPKPAGETDEIDGFSPDGTDLIFTRAPFPAKTAGQGTLMVEHVGGGVPVPIDRSALIGSSALPVHGLGQVQWSPDGRWIAFQRGLELEVVSTAPGSVPHVLATHFGSDALSWSPDSTRIAYDCCSNAPTERLITVSPAGTDRAVLTSTTSVRFVSEDSLDRPQWSPDSSKLVFMARLDPGTPAPRLRRRRRRTGAPPHPLSAPQRRLFPFRAFF